MPHHGNLVVGTQLLGRMPESRIAEHRLGGRSELLNSRVGTQRKASPHSSMASVTSGRSFRIRSTSSAPGVIALGRGYPPDVPGFPDGAAQSGLTRK